MGLLERAENELRRAQTYAGRFDAAHPTAPAIEESLTVIRASNLKPEPIRWLWPGWLAQGKLHVLAGSPGTGKTTLAIALAASVTSGGRWPDGSRAQIGNVLVWSGEDDPRDTLLPRLLAAEGVTDKTFFVSTVTSEQGERSFDPARDVELLDARIRQIGSVKLLIVDPIVNAVAGDSHKNGEVRRALAPLVDLAQRHDIAVLGISHFSKGTGGREPLERVTGSLAFGALARIVLVAAKGKADDDGDIPLRLFARAKSNIGPDDGGFGYLIEYGPAPGHEEIETSWVKWAGPIEGSARELLAAIEPEDGDEAHGALADAKAFLRDLLGGERKPVKDIQKAASAAGHSWATVKRAKAQLRVEAAKTGMEGGWVWQLPAEGAQEESKVLNKKAWAPSGEVEHLRTEAVRDDDWEALA
jgi:Mrp family chromosome partitioning ATPase